MERVSYIPTKYFDRYNKKQPITLIKHFNKIKAIDSSAENFEFYFSNSAAHSAMIEGNIIDFDSYLKYKYTKMNNKGKSFQEIEELKEAYAFAKGHKLTLVNFLKSHEILSKTLISESKYRGKIRDKTVFVIYKGQIIYTGASKEIVKTEMNRFFADIDILLKRDLSISEIFYYASMLHLVFVHIHPFSDGNGRASRLIEKWFLAQKLGDKAWFIQSEKLYQNRIVSYYKNVDLGDNYNIIDYDYSIPFLLMLPMALRVSK